MSDHIDHILSQFAGSKIAEGASIHESCQVALGAEISAEALLAPEVYIGKYTKVVGAVHIGRGVKVHELSTLVGPLHIGENAIIGPGVVIGLGQADTDARHTFLMEACRIGRAVQILAGVRVGRHARIRAGSLVSGDVPSYGLAAQNPAVLERYACPKCGGNLVQVMLVRGAIDTRCEACGHGDYRFARQFYTEAFNRVLLPYHALGALVQTFGTTTEWIDEKEMGGRW
jgi:UDP-2-acetamido-3-amino-2,3-dideoxy-glucuronate N-acetyltransferase